MASYHYTPACTEGPHADHYLSTIEQL